MINNLFSVFDPAANFNLSVNWIRSILLLLFSAPLFWLIPNKFSILFDSITLKLHSEFKTLLGPTSISGSSVIFISLFIFILFNNFLGLFPYVFTSSRHITITLTLAFPLWLRYIIFGWIKHTNHIFAHLVPQRTPGALIPFIVIIESIRNIIRPLTLSVRLIANIVAGHLLITLLGNQTALASNLILIRLLVTQILLLTLESAVAIIQSYVFAVLSTLYSGEITSH